MSINYKDFQNNENYILVTPEENIFVEIESRRAFIKDGDNFKEMDSRDIYNYFKE